MLNNFTMTTPSPQETISSAVGTIVTIRVAQEALKGISAMNKANYSAMNKKKGKMY